MSTAEQPEAPPARIAVRSLSTRKDSAVGILEDEADTAPSGELATQDEVHERARAALRNEELRELIQNRRIYAQRIFVFVVIWVGLMLLVVGFEGFGKYLVFDLSDTVLTTLIGATTANVLGLFAIVARYLFSRGDEA